MSFLIYAIPLAVLGFVLLRRKGLSGAALNELLGKGAQVVDVRTTAEFRAGHPKDAKNIPLDQLEARSKELDPSRPVLLCCASGSRSGLGVSLLKHCGFKEVHNAGCWTALKRS